ncbi:hypothetical protein KJ969_05185 [Patescibacteria group bacterium]|nr:hypothetical protein [Patescibacteria group bacterium]MBU1921616.1 hypothetical protein [Patescibacteria group bacterium]
MSEKGRCSVCGIQGGGDKDFLCEDCADPEKIFLACTQCGLFKELDIEQLGELQEASNLKFPVKKGITLKVSSCSRCNPENARAIELTAYALKGL